MTVTYDPASLSVDTPTGRLYVVRLLVGDTDTDSAELQDEEINFALLTTLNKVYNAASYCATLLASKFSDRVNTELDGALKAEYSTLAENYRKLSVKLKEDGKIAEGTSLGIYVGGLPTDGTSSYTFYRGQFRNNDYGF